MCALIVTAPIALAFEFAASGTGPNQADSLVAHRWIQDAVASLGPIGPWIPFSVLLFSLLGWHVVREHAWHVNWRTLLVMPVEALLLSLPLLVMRGVLLVAGGAGLRDKALVAGAGVYEELVFRACLIGVSLWFIDALRVPRWYSRVLTVVVASLIFASAHVPPFGTEIYSAPDYALRFLAGSYLGVLFLTRGFGIAALAHAGYNLLVLMFG